MRLSTTVDGRLLQQPEHLIGRILIKMMTSIAARTFGKR
jgi:hypothetical protein